MINITYEIWSEACGLIKQYSKIYGKFYMQLYPFYNFNNLRYISSKNFYDLYVDNGAIFANYENFDKIDNYCRKNDGSYRKRFLLTPIMYIYYIAIGLYFSKKYNQKRNKEIYVKYAGDFENKDLHYRKSYSQFVRYVSNEALNYDYYYKIDISDCFNKIDVDLLTNLLSNSFKFNPKEQLMFKEFIKWSGDGNFPQTECGVTSSYLATIVYFDIIDNRLFNLLSKEKSIKCFKICRYVDDLYILLSLYDNNEVEKIENKISSIYENIIYKYNLTINREKSNFKKSSNIFSDLKSFSILEDYEVNIDIPIEYKEYLSEFLKELTILSENGSINYLKYNDLIKKYFNNPESIYHAGQILYILIYKNVDWLSETEIIEKITKIIDSDFNVLSLDPRRLVSLIVNTHNEGLIKKFLYKLYSCSENGNWLIAHNFMVFQYLLYRGYASVKLLNKMGKYYPEIVNFINRYYKKDWRKSIINYNLDLQVQKLNYSGTTISFFKFLEIMSLKKGDLLQAQAYNKNYFDSITKNIELIKGFTNNQKVFYTKEDLRQVYVSKLGLSIVKWNLINNLCDRRNDNPLCHANCNIFIKKQDISISISNDIKDINELIDFIIENLL